MADSDVRIRYRPIKIGWCIEDGNLDQLRRALRLTHTLWGGTFNPIIPVGTADAGDLVRKFRVDLLLGLASNEGTDSFLDSFRHLSSQPLNAELFERVAGRYELNFLDVSHPLQKISDETAKGIMPIHPYGFVRWSADEPLADVLLCTFGAYPTRDEVGIDYEQFYIESTRPAIYVSNSAEPFPAYLLDQTMPSDICALDMQWDRSPARTPLGLYAGKAQEFQDLINYWNLRAAGLDVLFLDPDHSERLTSLRTQRINYIKQRTQAAAPGGVAIQVWSRSQEIMERLDFSARLVPFYTSLEGSASIATNLRPTLQYLSSRTVLTSVSSGPDGSLLSLQLPEKPFKTDDDAFRQHFAISVRPPYDGSDSNTTLWTPYLPQLNGWYGRKLLAGSCELRVELEGFGIITDINRESLRLSLLTEQDLSRQLFDFAGIDAQQSEPGRIASRLIAQLGGLQGCRVLMIAGVRNLIKQHSPLEEFTRTDATGFIGDRNSLTGRPNFAPYEDLFIEERDPNKTKLLPEDAFLYLLDKAVFRVGLTLNCTVCRLDFWVGIDDVATQVTCDLCGSKFSVARQLKDRCWKYRRSGLFGKNNNQEGSIPVALTLLRLKNGLRSIYSPSIYSTNLSLKPKAATINACETDVFIALQELDRVEIAIGECKDAGSTIEANDAMNLGAVADAFETRGIDSYIVFAKTASFTSDDIANCRLAQPRGKRRRVIMLSKLALELHGFRDQEPEAMSSARSLAKMAEATHELFLK